MTENNKGETGPDREERQKLEKEIMELLSSASGEGIEETKILPGKKAGQEAEPVKEQAEAPKDDLATKFLDLFPEAAPPGDAKTQERPSPESAAKEAAPASGQKKSPPESPALQAKELPEVKTLQAVTGAPQNVAAPAAPQQEKAPAPAAPAAEEAKAQEVLPEQWAVSKQESFLSRLLKPLQKNTLCLSLEGNYIRVLALRGKEVKRWATLQLNPRYIRNGVIVNPSAWGEQLHDILKKEQIQAGNLHCALSAVSVIREFKFPGLSGNKLGEVVEREARRVLSYSSETSLIRWQKVESRGQSVRVFVMVVPREPILKLVEALGFAGLKPKFIELKPTALMRAIRAGNAIIVHGELNSLELSVVIDGEPRVLRSLYLGDVLLARDEANARLIDELARTLSFYNETYREEPLDMSVPLYMTGELAIGSPLSTQIRALTGRVVASLNIDLIYPPSFPLPAYLVNIGLALKAVG